MAKTKTKSKNISLRKKWAVIISVFVILTITFLAIKPTFVKAPTQSNNSSETADWKTYSSKSFSALYPSDWTEFKYKNAPFDSAPYDEDIFLRSSDYDESLIPNITNGAEIRIYKRPNTKNQSLKKYIEDGLPTPMIENIKDLEEVKYGNNSYQHLFQCWEGCSDSYYLESENSFYIVHFLCAPNCSSEENVIKNKYNVVKTAFLEKVKFSKP